MDVADRRQDRRSDHRLTPGIVISRSALGSLSDCCEGPIEFGELRRHTFKLTDVPADDHVLQQPAAGRPATCGLGSKDMALVSWDQVGMQNGLDPAFCSNKLSQHPHAFRYLPSMRCVVSSAIHTSGKRPPAWSFAKVAASTLSVFTRAQAIAFTRRGFATTTRFTYGRKSRSTAVLLPVASITTSSSFLSDLAKRRVGLAPVRPVVRALFVRPPRSPPERTTGECPFQPRASPPPLMREPVGYTTSTDSRSQRSRASRRGGQVTTRVRNSWS